ncbi:MAG TPA: hypothetical protein VF648_13240 [Pyrinomonadaceae bacterium]|jgi:hypothetical protein
MKQILLLWFLTLGFFCAIGSSSDSYVSAQTAPDADEFLVYKAILQGFIRKETKRLVIKKQTSTVSENFASFFGEGLPNILPPLLKETVDDFSSRNQKSATLTNKFDLNVKINFVGEEINKLFENNAVGGKDGWKIFNKKYPNANGIIEVSRVGFNKSKTQALISLGQSCGWLCGNGSFRLLTKKNNKWEIENTYTTWNS